MMTIRLVTTLLLALLTVGCGYDAETPLSSPEEPPTARLAPPAPIAHLHTVGQARAGVPTPFALRLRDETGAPVALDELAGESLHVVAVRKDLSWLEHAHPRATQAGTFTFELTFPDDGAYAVFAVIVPRGRERKTLRTDVVVGDASTTLPNLPPPKNERSFGRYDVALTTRPPRLLAGEWATLTFRLERSGMPVTDLRSDASAGHLVMIDETATDLVYAHSSDGEAVRGIRAKAHQPAIPPSLRPHEHRGDDRGPEVQFHAIFPKPGRYKVWAEFAPGDDHLTADFVVDVIARRGLSE